MSFKAPISSSSSSSFQTSSSIKLTEKSVPSVRDKNQNNYDDIQSCETEINKNYSIPTTSTPNIHAQIIATTPVIILNLHTTTGLPPVGK